MSRVVKKSEAPSASQLAAITIDSGAALALCTLLLEVLAQMPEAQGLIRAALERAEARTPDGDPAARAAELIAVGRLREVCEIQTRKAA